MVDIEQADGDKYQCLTCVNWYELNLKDATFRGIDELFSHLENVHGWVREREANRKLVL